MIVLLIPPKMAAFAALLRNPIARVLHRDEPTGGEPTPLRAEPAPEARPEPARPPLAARTHA